LRKKTFIKWSGFALVLWALQLLVRDFTFAFTHGTTEADMDLTFLGLNSLQYARLWTAFGLLGLIGLAGVYVQVSRRLSKTGKAGFWVAFLGLALWFTAQVMQVWILDPDVYFYSPLVYGGWLLSIVSYFVLAAGLVLAGTDIQRASALPRGRSLILIIGILMVPTVLLVGYIVGHSDDSLPWKLLYGGISVPYDLCWLWLGVLLLAATPGVPNTSE
jgi:hypothetical protein